MKKHIKTINKKYKTTKITLATLSLGVLIAPVQSALGHIITTAASDSGHIMVKAELHPHSTDHGTWHGHYVNPRSIRAVGYGDGKDDSFNSKDNWDYYSAKA